MTAMTRQMTLAVIGRLVDVGIGEWVPAGAFSGALPGLLAGSRVLPQTPDAVIQVAVYAQDHMRALPTSLLRVQLRIRGVDGDPLGADDIGDTCFPALHDQRHQWWGGVEIASCEWLSTAPLGIDALGRAERADNYQIITQRKDDF